MKIIVTGFLLLSSMTVFARECRVYSEDINRRGQDKLIKAGFTMVDSKANADVIVFEGGKVKENAGVFGLPGNGHVNQDVVVLVDANTGVEIAVDVMMSCRVSGRQTEQGIECQSFTMGDYEAMVSNTAVRLVKRHACK